MKATAYLIDSNAIIQFLDETLPEKAIDRLEQIVDDEDYVISVINEIEVLSFGERPKALAVAERFVQASTVIQITGDIIAKTIEIRQRNKIKLPDAVIAATALVHNLIVITRNTKDFKKVPDLKVINPYDIT